MTTALRLMALNGALTAGDRAMSPLMRAVSYQANSIKPNLLPTPEQLASAFRGGTIDADVLSSIARNSGVLSAKPMMEADRYQSQGGRLILTPGIYGAAGTVWDQIFDSTAFVPPLSAIFDLYNRGLISDEVLSYWLKRIGLHSIPAQKAIGSLTAQMPPIQDMIRFAVKEVFNPVLRGILRLDEGFDENPEFIEWAHATGLRPTLITAANGQQHLRDFSRDYWAAHWQNASPTQMYEMLHRLRPERIAFWRQVAPTVDAFTMDDLLRGLKIEDYGPYWRDKLAAISFRIPTRVDVRRMIGLKSITPDDAFQYYQDMGYDKTTAAKLTDFAVIEGSYKPSISVIKRWYSSGRIAEDTAKKYMRRWYVTEEEANRLLVEQTKHLTLLQSQRLLRKKIIKREDFFASLRDQGYRDNQILWLERDALDRPAYVATRLAKAKISDAYSVGVIDEPYARQAFRDLGIPDQEIDLGIATIKLENRISFGRKLIAAIRKEFLRGIVSRDEGDAHLSSIGMDATKRSEYLHLWDIELNASRRQFSAQKNVDAYKRGLISETELRRRLVNLNFGGADISLFVLMGQQDIQIAVAKAAADAARTAAQQESAAKAAVRAADAARRRAMSDMAKHGTPPTLIGWMTKGLIDQDTVFDRLRAMGWPTADANRLIDEGWIKHGEKKQKEIASSNGEGGQQEPTPAQ